MPDLTEDQLDDLSWDAHNGVALTEDQLDSIDELIAEVRRLRATLADADCEIRHLHHQEN